MTDVCHPASASAARPSSAAPRVALAGNPNVGKSTVFNALTGARQHVGNWPGKTVEQRTGCCRRGMAAMDVVDLPGTYSLAAASPEEVIAEAVLTGEDIDAVAVVVDSSNLERNLYLAAQIGELGRPSVLVLNMVDAAAAEGHDIDDDELAATLGAPVVRTVGRAGQGIDDLVTRLEQTWWPARRTPPGPHLRIDYGDLEADVVALARALDAIEPVSTVSSRWVAVRLLEGDPATVGLVTSVDGGPPLVRQARAAAERLEQRTGLPVALLVADRRFEWAHAVAGAAVARRDSGRSVTDRVDDVLTSGWAGIPLFLLLMWAVFKVVTDVAAPLVDWVDGVVAGPVSGVAAAGFEAIGLGGTWVAGVVVDGAIAGVGAVLVFVPILVLLYLVLGVLEDSGYMARAAFLMDRVMRPIGLNGRSFLPLLLGFGCNVPGVYATRVLDRRRDRIVTALLVPFVTCAARLPIYVLLAAAFFPAARGTVVFAMYVASIVVVLLVGAVLDRLVLRDARRSAFILELPPYRRPSVRVLGTYVWQRVRAFVGKAGSIILVCSVAVWLLLAVPVSGSGSFNDTPMDASAFATVADGIAPTLAPAGLGTWEVAGTLVTGLVAKEVVVATLEQVYAPEATAVDGQASTAFAPLRRGLDASSGGHGTLAAAALLAFMLLYVPCMATIGAIRHELGGRWAVASVVLNFVIAWTVAVTVFQGGRALGVG